MHRDLSQLSIFKPGDIANLVGANSPTNADPRPHCRLKQVIGQTTAHDRSFGQRVSCHVSCDGLSTGQIERQIGWSKTKLGSNTCLDARKYGSLEAVRREGIL